MELVVTALSSPEKRISSTISGRAYAGSFAHQTRSVTDSTDPVNEIILGLQAVVNMQPKCGSKQSRESQITV